MAWQCFFSQPVSQADVRCRASGQSKWWQALPLLNYWNNITWTFLSVWIGTAMRCMHASLMTVDRQEMYKHQWPPNANSYPRLCTKFQIMWKWELNSDTLKAMTLHYAICRVHVLSWFIQQLKRRSEPTHNINISPAHLLCQRCSKCVDTCIWFMQRSPRILWSLPLASFWLPIAMPNSEWMSLIRPSICLFFCTNDWSGSSLRLDCQKLTFAVKKHTHTHTHSVHHSECVFVRTVQIGVPAGSAPGCPRVIKNKKPASHKLYQTTNKHYDKIKKKEGTVWPLSLRTHLLCKNCSDPLS